MNSNDKRIKYACYISSASIAITTTLPPLLFLTFQSLYGISYSLLGTLVLINFISQLAIDLIFSFFSYKFNIEKTVKAIPLITILGLILFAISPFMAKDYIYICLAIGISLFSLSSGFCEVLLSPVIAALPLDNPQKEISTLHSMYAWGVVTCVLLSTVYFSIFGSSNWQWLAIFLSIVPITSTILFYGQSLPKMETPKQLSGTFKLLKNKGLWLGVVGIFFGGAAECTMSQWSSGFLELSLGISKVWGDILGVALFAVMLGIGRNLYGKYGKNIQRVLLLGSIGAAICYFIASVSSNPIIVLIACMFTGFCTSMLWPGSLITITDRFPQGGVFVYALMAAGGDLGASVGPQLVGTITDIVAKNPTLISMANSMALQSEQLGIRFAMLFAALFPLAGAVIYFIQWHKNKKYVK